MDFLFTGSVPSTLGHRREWQWRPRRRRKQRQWWRKATLYLCTECARRRPRRRQRQQMSCSMLPYGARRAHKKMRNKSRSSAKHMRMASFVSANTQIQSQQILLSNKTENMIIFSFFFHSFIRLWASFCSGRRAFSLFVLSFRSAHFWHVSGYAMHTDLCQMCFPFSLGRFSAAHDLRKLIVFDRDIRRLDKSCSTNDDPNCQMT